MRQDKLDIYKTINWEGKHEGKVFLPNSIVVAYYTHDKNMESSLQQCITSFKYDENIGFQKPVPNMMLLQQVLTNVFSTNTFNHQQA